LTGGEIHTLAVAAADVIQHVPLPKPHDVDLGSHLTGGEIHTLAVAAADVTVEFISNIVSRNL